MKWAVEIMKTGLERRNLRDLLSAVDFTLVEGVDAVAFTGPSLDSLLNVQDVWVKAKRLRDSFVGAADIDSAFTLGPVIEYTADGAKRHFFDEIEAVNNTISWGVIESIQSPPPNLSESELAAWRAAQTEQEYQTELDKQRSRFIPAYREPRAEKVLKLLKVEPHTGETLYKIFELMEDTPAVRKLVDKHRKLFLQSFGILEDEFNRFREVVHNPAVSGDFARHAYSSEPRNPMSVNEAEQFIKQLADRWLASIR
jgi:hypothetical protein